MTSADALSRLRALLDEYGVTSGYFIDDVLYKYLDSAQLEVITLLKGKQDAIRRMDKSYECETLKALLTVVNGSISASGRELSLPADFLFDNSMRLGLDTNLHKATLESYDNFWWKEDNLFARATSSNPRYYIRGTKFGFAPTPASGSVYSYAYYANPTSVASGVNFLLGAETHNGIIHFALSYALTQDNRTSESSQARNTAINLIKDL